MGYVFDPLNAPDCGVGPPTLDQSLPPQQPWSHFSGPWGVYDIPVTPGDRSNMPSSVTPDDGLHCSLDSSKNVMSAHLTKPDNFLSDAAGQCFRLLELCSMIGSNTRQGLWSM